MNHLSVFGTGSNDFQKNVEMQPGYDQWRPLEIKTYQGLPLSWIEKGRLWNEIGREGNGNPKLPVFPDMFTSDLSLALLLKLP